MTRFGDNPLTACKLSATIDVLIKLDSGLIMASILVVDDDAQVRSMVRLCLEESGHRVYEASDGTVAMTSYHLRRPDIVITDIYMPQMEGLEFIRELRTLYGDVKIIAISGGSKIVPGDFLSTALELGAKFVIDKPFGPPELLKAVNALLQAPTAA
jgi:CheY-like chemotaxis protein